MVCGRKHLKGRGTNKMTEKRKERIEKIILALNTGIEEKGEVIAVSLLAALAGQNIFLLGPPGTAKSLISRRLASAFNVGSYFEYLMQRFSTPEEVFGPISLSELKNDKYVRKTDGYLPTSGFAFLDEIWKAGPAILNTLLTIINEKKFRNGTEVKDVPLKALVSASNEIPPDGQGLEALYDRMLVRLLVSPIEARDNFVKVIQNVPTKDCAEIGGKITDEEYKIWQSKIDGVKLATETLDIIHRIRADIEKYNESGEKNKVYISDRRWQRASRLLKAAAFFCDRGETNLVDALLLKHCLWSKLEERDKLTKIVEGAVRVNGFDSDISYSELEDEKNKLDAEINKELYFSEDIYHTKMAGGQSCLPVHIRTNARGEVDFFIPESQMGADGAFKPIDSAGNEISWLSCDFKGQKSFTLRCDGDNIYSQDQWVNTIEQTPKISFNKGDLKKDVNDRLFYSLDSAVQNLKDDVKTTITEINVKEVEFKQHVHTPFVLNKDRKIAIESVSAQLERLGVISVDCERMGELIKKAKDKQ